MSKKTGRESDQTTYLRIIEQLELIRRADAEISTLRSEISQLSEQRLATFNRSRDLDERLRYYKENPDRAPITAGDLQRFERERRELGIILEDTDRRLETRRNRMADLQAITPPDVSLEVVAHHQATMADHRERLAHLTQARATIAATLDERHQERAEEATSQARQALDAALSGAALGEVGQDEVTVAQSQWAAAEAASAARQREIDHLEATARGFDARISTAEGDLSRLESFTGDLLRLALQPDLQTALGIFEANANLAREALDRARAISEIGNLNFHSGRLGTLPDTFFSATNARTIAAIEEEKMRLDRQGVAYTGH